MTDPEEGTDAFSPAPSTAEADYATEASTTAGDAEEDEDCYWDGPYLVFTEAFHLKRGYCCSSGCRHCPWRDKESPLPGS